MLLRTLSATLALAAALVAFVPPVEARGRERSSQNSRGATRESRVERQQGDIERESTTTGAQGRVLQHRYQRDWDPASGTGTASATTTLPDGRTTGRESTIARTAPGSGTVNGTYHRADGSTGSYSASTSGGDGSRTTDKSLTTAAGKTVSAQTTTTKTDTGLTRATTVTGPSGATASTQTDVAKEGSSTSVTHTTTPPAAEPAKK